MKSTEESIARIFGSLCASTQTAIVNIVRDAVFERNAQIAQLKLELAQSSREQLAAANAAANAAIGG